MVAPNAGVWKTLCVSESEMPDLAAEVDSNIGANLKARRELYGLSQADLAMMLTRTGLKGFHQTTIARIEKGERPLRAAEVVALGRVLETSLEELAESDNAAGARERVRTLLDRVTAFKDAAKHLVELRRITAQYLDAVYPEGAPLDEALVELTRIDVSPDVIDRLEDIFDWSEPANQLHFVFMNWLKEWAGTTREKPERELGYREQKLEEDMRQFVAGNGEH